MNKNILPDLSISSNKSALQNIKNAFAKFEKEPIWVISGPDKKPINVATGKYAACNNSSAWHTLSEVEGFLEKHPEYLPTIALVPDSGLVCLDLDRVIDENGVLSPEAREVVELFDSKKAKFIKFLH